MSKLAALIDGSIYRHSVCDHAAWAAKRAYRDVQVMHFLERRDVSSVPHDLSGSLSLGTQETLLQELSALDAQRAKLTQARGRVLLTEAKARVEAQGIGTVVTKLRHGDLVESVEEFDVDLDLIVMGKRGEAADLAKLHLGSNLERVLRATKKPILVAPRSFQPIERFLIAFDGGPSALKAVDSIATGSLLAGLSCQLIMAGSGNTDTEMRLSQAANKLRAGGFPVDVTSAPGEPEGLISAIVGKEKMNLLVMGAHGHSRIRSMIIGSTTTNMVRSCKIPVLLFR